MDDQKLISQIEELGLSNKEARVYVACLKLGPSAVQRIADQSSIKRVTTYVILESLIGLGLVSQSTKGKKTYFVAEDPSNMKRLLDRREQEIKEHKQNFEMILPQLQNLKMIPQEMPEVKFYDGSDGVRTLFANFFETYKGSATDIYAFSNIDQVHNFFPERAGNKSNPDRLKYHIRSHIIYTSKHGHVYQTTDDISDRESRFVPAELYPVTGDINVIGDYVILISYADNRGVGVTIRNAEMANAMRAIFAMTWDLAGTLDVNRPAK